MDLESEAEARKEKFYIPNWFSVEIKTGVSESSIHAPSPSSSSKTLLQCVNLAVNFSLADASHQIGGVGLFLSLGDGFQHSAGHYYS